MQFIKKGKAGGDYQALVEQALKAELAEDNNHNATQNISKYCVFIATMNKDLISISLC